MLHKILITSLDPIYSLNSSFTLNFLNPDIPLFYTSTTGTENFKF